MSGTISGSGTFGALAARVNMGTPRRGYAGPPNINMPAVNSPIVDPETGQMTQTWLQYQTKLASDVAELKKQLGLA